jgi:hypothetical protein
MANGFLSTDSLVPYGNQMVPNTVTTAPRLKPKDNSNLGMMLYALGGALRGDKNFVENTMQLQQMQEGKKREKQMKENYQEFLKTIDPDSPFYDLAKSIGYEGLPQLLLERYKTEQPKQIDPSKAMKQEELNVLNKLKQFDGNVEKLSSYEKIIYDNFIKRDDSQSILEQLGLIPGKQINTNLIIEKIEG